MFAYHNVYISKCYHLVFACYAYILFAGIAFVFQEEVRAKRQSAWNPVCGSGPEATALPRDFHLCQAAA